MEFLIILTLAQPCDTGFQQVTMTRTVTAGAGSTRAGLLSWALDRMPPEMRDGTVLFFSAEPNRLGAGLGAGEGR